MNTKAQKQLFGEPVLSTSYRDPYKLILFPRATLYADIIELTGYTATGPFMKRVNLRYVEWVEWKHGSKHEANLILWFSTGDTFRLRVASAGLWKYEIEARVRELTGRFSPGKRPSVYRLLHPVDETPTRLQDSMGLTPNPESLVEKRGNRDHANQRG